MICKCSCHSSNNVRHIVACCDECPVCLQKIKHHAYDHHVKECQDKMNKLVSDALDRQND